MGQVSVAVDRDLDRSVALKEIQPRYADEPRCRARFLREARITGRLEHPGIVPVYAVGQGPDGRPHYAMRFIEGQSLGAAIRHFHDPQRASRDPGERLLELRQLLARFVVVCNTMAYAHNKGVIHRDIKPDNIMLGPYGETLVVDWGLAKELRVEDQTAENAADSNPPQSAISNPQVDGAETGTGLPVGTPVYMSPEQAAGALELVGQASDVYSLGATLYTLLTGERPFTDTLLAEVLEKVRGGIFIHPHQLDKRVPKALDAITRKAMAWSPKERYGSAQELADDVERYLADEPVRAAPDSWAQRVARLARRHKDATWAAAVALVTVAVVAVGALVLVSGARNREAKQYAINNLNRDLADGWQAQEWGAAQLAHMDNLADQLADLDPEAAPAARERTNEIFAAAIRRQRLRDVPTFDDAAQARFLTDLERLRTRAPELVGPLREDFDRRLRQWEPLFALAAPFNNLAQVFVPQQVRIEQELLPQVPADGTRPLIPTRIRSGGIVRLTATFAFSWSSAPAVGILLNLADGHGYQFLVTVPEYVPGRHEDKLHELSSLAATLKTGERIKVLIIRDGVLLRSLVTSLAQGPLVLEASREGGRLTLIVNGRENLTFEDPFPLGPTQPGVFGVFWPQGVGLTALTGSRQALSVRPSPLEQGDELFAAGEYRKALKFYEDQVLQGGRGPAGQEARYKQALALLEVGQKEQGLKLLRELLAETPERATLDSARWPVLAASRLWLIYLRDDDLDEAEKVVKQLPPEFGFEQLATLVPAEDREYILDHIRLRGSRWRSAITTQKDLERVQRAIRIEELINESPYERRMTRWRLMDAYRVAGNLPAALVEVNTLLSQRDLPLDERAAFLREKVWMVIETRKSDQLAAALEEVNQLLEANPTDPVMLPLLLERARVHVAEERWSAADRDVDEFFARADKGQLDYADWADASLLRGFLRLHNKDEMGAQEAWRAGLLRNFPGGLPTLPPGRSRVLSGIANNNRTNGLSFYVMLASLTGEMTEAEATFAFNHVISGSGSTDPLLRVIAKRPFPPDFMRDVQVAAYRTPRGREHVKRVAFRQVSLSDFFLGGLRLLVAEALRLGSYPKEEPLPEGLEPEFYRGACDLVEWFNEGKVDTNLARDILSIWHMKDDPADAWTRVGPALEPNLRVRGAAVLGRRLLAHGKPQWGIPLLREVVARTKPDNIFHRIALMELRKLKAAEP
jgi:tRNA A-37 threonylcarbamoyl transferase component Bud32